MATERQHFLIFCIRSRNLSNLKLHYPKWHTIAHSIQTRSLRRFIPTYYWRCCSRADSAPDSQSQRGYTFTEASKTLVITDHDTQKNGKPSSSSSSAPPMQSQQVHSQAQQAAHSQQYSKPAPPLPMDRRNSPQTQPPANYGYGASPPSSHGYNSPPPGSYGARPQSGQGGRQQPMSRPPPSPAPPNGADPALWPLFKAVDKDGRSESHLPPPDLVKLYSFIANVALLRRNVVPNS